MVPQRFGAKIISTGKTDLGSGVFLDNHQITEILAGNKDRACKILGVSSLPATLDELHNTDSEWILTRTGIEKRPIVGYEIATSDLAISAAKNALNDAGLKSNQINMIRLATVSPDYLYSPATVWLIAKGIGIPVWNVEGMQLHELIGTDQSNACSSFPVALMDAYAYLSAGLCEYVLVIGADKMSTTVDWHDRRVSVILADHAAALVLKRVPYEQSDFKPEWFFAGGDGSKGDRIIAPYGGSRCPLSHEVIEGDQLLSGTKLQMAGNEVFRELVGLLKSNIIPEALKKAGLTPAMVDIAFFHQANIRMINPVEKLLRKLGLRAEAVVFNTIDRYGNTTCASVPLGIHDARCEGVLKKDYIVMLVTMGGGYTWNIVFLRWSL